MKNELLEKINGQSSVLLDVKTKITDVPIYPAIRTLFLNQKVKTNSVFIFNFVNYFVSSKYN